MRNSLLWEARRVPFSFTAVESSFKLTMKAFSTIYNSRVNNYSLKLEAVV